MEWVVLVGEGWWWVRARGGSTVSSSPPRGIPSRLTPAGRRRAELDRPRPTSIGPPSRSLDACHAKRPEDGIKVNEVPLFVVSFWPKGIRKNNRMPLTRQCIQADLPPRLRSGRR